MKKTILGHMDVYNLVDKFYDDNLAKFTTHPNIIATFGKIKTNNKDLHDFGVIQTRNNKGLTENKKTTKQILAINILLNAGVAAAFYANNGNTDLFNNFNFPPKSFPRTRPETMLQIADRVIDSLTTNLLQLAGTGVTTISIAAIATARDNFIAAMKEPAATRKAKAVVTKQISVLDKATFKIIREELSNQMLIFIVSEPDLYANYLKVIDITAEGVHKHNTPKVLTSDVTVQAIHDLTEEPVVGIIAEFEGNATIYTTDINGMFTAKQTYGEHLCRLVGVNFIANSFTFNNTAAGYTIIIRMVPTGV